MSCVVCNGLPGCPSCTPEPTMIPCPDCGGDGGVFYNEEGDEISRVEYDKLSAEQQEDWEFEPCEYCDGDGEIEAEPYEPDYDNYDD